MKIKVQFGSETWGQSVWIDLSKENIDIEKVHEMIEDANRNDLPWTISKVTDHGGETSIKLLSLELDTLYLISRNWDLFKLCFINYIKNLHTDFDFGNFCKELKEIADKAVKHKCPKCAYGMLERSFLLGMGKKKQYPAWVCDTCGQAILIEENRQ